jgi:hypothetical protein
MNRTPATINRKLTLSGGIAAVAGAANVSGLFTLRADAAEPANRACVGESLLGARGTGLR